MEGLVTQLAWYCGFALLAMLVRIAWHVGNTFRLENLEKYELEKIKQLERQVAIARFKCAATNPNAEKILARREELLKKKMNHQDHVFYMRYFIPDISEIRDVPLSEDDASEAYYNDFEPDATKEPPCSTADES